MDTAIAFLTLSAMEIVLGIDNIIFISILVAKLPKVEQPRIRAIGMGLALVLRVGLLLSISWVMSLQDPLFSVMNQGFSGRDLILLVGGLFLIAKSTSEIHEKMEGEHHTPEVPKSTKGSARTRAVLTQIILLDIVFSLDSVITAVGMANQVWVMVSAMLIAVAVMMFSAQSIGDFVERHPTIKILALSFLLLIGVMLVGEGMGMHVPKGYIYFAMAFSLGVEFLNLKIRTKQRGA